MSTAARERIYPRSLVLDDDSAVTACWQHSQAGKVLEIHQEIPGRVHVAFARQPVGF